MWAAETTAAEMKDVLKSIVVRLVTSNVLLVATTGRYIFVITTDDKANIDAIFREASSLAAKADLDF